MDNPYQTPAVAVENIRAGTIQAFKDPNRLTWATRACLAASVVTSVASISFYLQLRALLQSAPAGGLSVDDVYGEVIVQLMLVGLMQLVVPIATIVVICMWIYRVAWNARAFAGARNMDFTPGWSVGWYFIPFANLWKPYQAMKEIWRASADPARMDHVGTPGWLPVWWLLWLANNVVSNISTRMSWRAETIQQELDATSPAIIADIVNIPLCFVFLVIVNGLFRMQRRQQAQRQATLAG